MAENTFYWYDFESWGTSPKKDKPSQFAGIRTDMDLNIIGEPLIQRELQQLFDKKFELSNMTIDDEITLLERKLNALKKIQNDTN